MWLTAAWLAWAGWYVALGTARSAVTIVDDSGDPVTDVEVLLDGDVIGVTDGSGRVEIDWRGNTPQFDLSASGYRPAWFEPRPGEYVVEIEPYVLTGRVTDPEGNPVAGVSVRSGTAAAVSNRSGEFEVVGGEPGRVVAFVPAWTEGAWEWDGSPGAVEIGVEPLVIKAAHVGGLVAGDPARWSQMLDLADSSELNGVMLDLKDEAGVVYYDSEVDLARTSGAVSVEFDLAELARTVRERELYLIGRIVSFQDPIVANQRPDLAVTVDGAVYTKRGQSFLDPTDPVAREYALSLAVEACGLGLDEVQFDYIRFPDGYPAEAVFDGPVDEESRVETIRSFLAEARSRLRPLGCAVAADVFGFTTTALDDGGIGQKWDVIAAELDVVSPMLYPSHYGAGWYSYDDPSEFPGGVVSQALQDGLARLETTTVVRPWLQDFSYDAGQVREQIDVAESLGLGWMLWNAASDVTVGALR